jgi:catechol 2,3-dioxygenase-like lactoylglutathione lyase family enzyme
VKASGFLHCALRSPDPVRIGKFYADLFEAGFFIHPFLSALGVVIVKIANPEFVFRGILEFWPLDIQWDGATASMHRIPGGLAPMQNHVAFRVDLAKEEIFEMLTSRGIAARYEPRSAGVVIVAFDDPDGNFVELFPNIETTELPPQAFCDAQELDRVMAECRAALD